MGGKRSPSALAGVAALACAAFAPIAASAQDGGAPSASEIPHTQPPAGDINRVLDLQNRERARLGMAPLAWDSKLADDARDWARALLERGEPDHSPASQRKGQGENLWMGTEGAWTTEAMVQMFLDEREFFQAGSFPEVSTTGNWYDVGHYSQIVWRDTRQVGCALATGNGKDVLVCRYFPAGNVHGEKPY